MLTHLSIFCASPIKMGCWPQFHVILSKSPETNWWYIMHFKSRAQWNYFILGRCPIHINNCDDPVHKHNHASTRGNVLELCFSSMPWYVASIWQNVSEYAGNNIVQGIAMIYTYTSVVYRVVLMYFVIQVLIRIHKFLFFSFCIVCG